MPPLPSRSATSSIGPSTLAQPSSTTATIDIPSFRYGSTKPSGNAFDTRAWRMILRPPGIATSLSADSPPSHSFRRCTFLKHSSGRDQAAKRTGALESYLLRQTADRRLSTPHLQRRLCCTLASERHPCRTVKEHSNPGVARKPPGTDIWSPHGKIAITMPTCAPQPHLHKQNAPRFPPGRSE